ncbi:ribonuclease p protein subunit p14 [Anaeramoeba flamelloides]|uniref:Ribonuclease p protein subunit p14 n=1 Tax=Anaeramoeba flamelloides TaxID=1746091 RepID=A0ABQ8XNI5_9EUKA|nr:ribonuclease p protein subunit p14 [Anaeramoeba flamelloides]
MNSPLTFFDIKITLPNSQPNEGTVNVFSNMVEIVVQKETTQLGFSTNMKIQQDLSNLTLHLPFGSNKFIDFTFQTKEEFVEFFCKVTERIGTYKLQLFQAKQEKTNLKSKNATELLEQWEISEKKRKERLLRLQKEKEESLKKGKFIVNFSFTKTLLKNGTILVLKNKIFFNHPTTQKTVFVITPQTKIVKELQNVCVLELLNGITVNIEFKKTFFCKTFIKLINSKIKSLSKPPSVKTTFNIKELTENETKSVECKLFLKKKGLKIMTKKDKSFYPYNNNIQIFFKEDKKKDCLLQYETNIKRIFHFSTQSENATFSKNFVLFKEKYKKSLNKLSKELKENEIQKDNEIKSQTADEIEIEIENEKEKEIEKKKNINKNKSSSKNRKSKHTFPIKYSEKEAFDTNGKLLDPIDGMVAIDKDFIKILKNENYTQQVFSIAEIEMEYANHLVRLITNMEENKFIFLQFKTIKAASNFFKIGNKNKKKKDFSDSGFSGLSELEFQPTQFHESTVDLFDSFFGIVESASLRLDLLKYDRSVKNNKIEIIVRTYQENAQKLWLIFTLTTSYQQIPCRVNVKKASSSLVSLSSPQRKIL